MKTKIIAKCGCITYDYKIKDIKDLCPYHFTKLLAIIHTENKIPIKLKLRKF